MLRQILIFYQIVSLVFSLRILDQPSEIQPLNSLNNTSDLKMGDYDIYDLSKIIKNTLEEFKSLNELEKVGSEIDDKLKIKDPKYISHENTQKAKNSILTEEKKESIDFLQKFKTKVISAECLRKEGFIKVREIDSKSKEVPLVYAVLTKDRLTYFLDLSDESSIQGSVELSKILTPIIQIENFPSCFQIKTLNSIHDCVICVENEVTAREWIYTITQNIVNCN